ncbi:DNA methyltransferase [Mucilaginibacter sp. PAMB04168]|uniref:DNA methyltransferase n=1 Tax=Mucilaginibacter sp. PAMB04168 TaxID=3138567 RepID=UPI0031F61BD8
MQETNVISVETVNFDEQIESYLRNYKLTGIPIEVSFRDLVPDLYKPDRYTHLIHSYPAKLLMHIPYFFLNNNMFSKKGELILDCFSGSGTVMLEAILAERNAIGADANPLARLISKVKVHQYSYDSLTNHFEDLLSNIKLRPDGISPNVPNVNFWFLPNITSQLKVIFNAISLIEQTEIRDFFLVCFSNCVKKVSLADPRVSVPVKLNPDRYKQSHPLYEESKRKLDGLNYLNVTEKFIEIVNDNIQRFKLLGQKRLNTYTASIISNDARNLTTDIGSSEKMLDGSVSLIISSPPYAGAQKYIRSSSLNLGWLNMVYDECTLKDLDAQNIGRENYKKSEYVNFRATGIVEADILLQKIYKINPLRAHIAGNYLREMREAFKEAYRVLKSGGYIVLVVGNNQVCGLEFETQQYLKLILEDLGMTTVLRLIDDIQSYGLMTKRNKTANVITREWVLVLKK